MAKSRAPRNTLSLERVITEGAALADEKGIESLTIRALAERLGVQPMALYHHVANKDALLDALVDVVNAEVYSPVVGRPWRDELAERSRSMRSALRSHPWALSLMETRAHPGPRTVAGHEAVLAVLAAAGFAPRQIGDAYAVLDAFVYGFALQESMLANVGLGTATEELAAGMDLTAAPHLADFASRASADDYAFGDSFEVGLDIVLEGIQRLTKC